KVYENAIRISPFQNNCPNFALTGGRREERLLPAQTEKPIDQLLFLGARTAQMESFSKSFEVRSRQQIQSLHKILESILSSSFSNTACSTVRKLRRGQARFGGGWLQKKLVIGVFVVEEVPALASPFFFFNDKLRLGFRVVKSKGPVMAHGKKPGNMSKVLAPGPPSCPSAGPPKPSQEDQSVSEETQRPPRSTRNDNNNQLTPPAASKHFYMSCDPSPEDMDDACSEYDNVGSDVEQDYDEVLHLNRQGAVRCYNQHGPEGAQQAEESREAPTADQITQKPHHSTKRCERPHSEGKPYRRGHRFKSHCAPIAGDEAEGGMKIIEGDRFFFNDDDDFEEVLDGARFIEDLDEAEVNAEKPASLYQGNESERIKKERNREDETCIQRNQNVSGAGKKSEPSQKGKERQVKGRGRGGGETQHVVSGIKAATISSTEQNPKTSSRKSAVRSKDRPGSSKHHHPPPPPPPTRHAQSPSDSQRAPPHRESPPTSGLPADNPENESRLIKASPGLQHPAEQQRESAEEKLMGSEEPEQDQDEKPSTAMMPEEAAEQPKQPQCPEPVSVEEDNSPKEGAAFPCFEDGPCEPEDLIDGIIFAANYLGCTQVLSDKNPSKSVRMSQAHEAVSHIKICSLMRGGIAERGGVRVGHRIIEINGQSVVAMAHEKIVQTLSVSVGEINMKTMPAVMFRLLTGQETPVYI
ncbi:hypothetical protein CCH79_00015378, partial [Gambusia affinis]